MTAQKTNRRFFSAWWFLAGVFVVAVLAVLAFGRAVYQDYQVKKEIARLQEEVKSLEGKKFSTLEVLKYMQSEKFLQDKARSEFNLAKPGENLSVISLPSSSDELTGQPADDMVKSSNLSNPEKWWNFFLKN